MSNETPPRCDNERVAVPLVPSGALPRGTSSQSGPPSHERALKVTVPVGAAAPVNLGSTVAVTVSTSGTVTGLGDDVREVVVLPLTWVKTTSLPSPPT